jgi:hypothetical protein
LEPGQSFVYDLRPFDSYGTTRRYSGSFTYRADTLNGPEYLSITLRGSHCYGICFPNDGPALSTAVFNGKSLPDFFPDMETLGPATTNPEIGWTASGNWNVWPGIDIPFDFTFQTKGNYTVDASKVPRQLPELLNAMCAGASGTKCSFTQTGEVHWGDGKADMQALVKSCGPAPPEGIQRVPQKPAADSPDWHEVTVAAERTRSVTVGGSLAASTEVNLFGVIDTEVSVRIGAEHEWGDTTAFEKTTKVFVPRDWLAGVWVAPVVGKVTGTLVVSTALAKYTITNFEETASGVSKDLRTPAFNIFTNSREMTLAEYHRLCPSSARTATRRVRRGDVRHAA